jgi:hypothetical protein
VNIFLEDQIQATSGSVNGSVTYNQSVNWYQGVVAFTAGLPNGTFVQRGTLNSSTLALSSSCVFPQNNGAGDTLILAIRAAAGGITVTDSQGNIWEPAGVNDSGALWYATNSKAGANSVTITYLQNEWFQAVCAEYSGLLHLDQGVQVATGNGTAAASYAVSTIASGDLIVGFGNNGTTNYPGITAGTGFIMRGQVNEFLEDMIQSTSGTVTSTATYSSSVSWNQGVAAFAPGPPIPGSFLQAGSVNGNSLTFSCGFPGPNQAGDTLVLVGYFQASATVTDTAGNSWINVTSGDNMGLWYATNAKAGANSVTVSYQQAEGFDGVCAEYSGAFHVDKASAIASGSGTAAASASISTTNAGELVIGYGHNTTTNGPGVTPETGFSLRGLVNIFLEDQIQATSGSVNGSVTYNQSVNWYQGVVAFVPPITTTSLTSSLNPSTYGASVTLTATVAPSTATGVVTFTDGTTTLGTGTLSSGTATYSTSTLTAGSHSIAASYSGDTKHVGSTSSALAQTVTKATPSFGLTSSSNPAGFGNVLLITAKMATGTGTGTVTFSDGGSALGTTLVNNNQATYVTSALVVGSHSLTAIYSGDSNNNSSTSPVLMQAVAVDGADNSTGNLATARYSHTATLLNNGSVLIAGGFGNGVIGTGELYSWQSGQFTATGSLVVPRYFHTATLLPNGMVLIAGGNTDGSTPTGAELYNPGSGTFTTTPGDLNTGRYAHTATLLNNGLVLIAGGMDVNGNALKTAELYNPATGTFAVAPSTMNAARYLHIATLLNDGTVLIVGGGVPCAGCGTTPLAEAEIYNPATETFTTVGGLNVARYYHTATLLNDGEVLIAGGNSGTNSSPTEFLASAELYNPLTASFGITGNLNTARFAHTATLLNNGMVLVEGGTGVIGPLSSAELYDPATSMFITSASMAASRDQFTSTLLDNGNVLNVGGFNATYLNSAELFQPTNLIPSGLVSISVIPSNPNILVGGSQQLLALGTFGNGTSVPLASVVWNSSLNSVASVTSDQTDRGVVFGIAVGSTTISACTGSLCGSATLSVVNALAPPIITSISPASAVMGALVTITGNNFGTTQGTSRVTFNGVQASSSGSSSTCSTNWSNTCIVVIVPTGVPYGIVTVVVTTQAGGSSTGFSFTDTTTQPNFSVSVTPTTQAVLSGGGTTYTVNVTPLNSFAGSVNLTQSGLPTGASASFNPSTIAGGSGTSTLTVSTTSSTPTGSSPIVISGTSGSLTANTVANLAVNIPTITGLSFYEGPPQMGFVITVSNFNPNGNEVVTVGGVNANIVSWTATTITVQVPAGLPFENADVVVTNVGPGPEYGTSNSVPFNVIQAVQCILP